MVKLELTPDDANELVQLMKRAYQSPFIETESKIFIRRMARKIANAATQAITRADNDRNG